MLLKQSRVQNVSDVDDALLLLKLLLLPLLLQQQLLMVRMAGAERRQGRIKQPRSRRIVRSHNSMLLRCRRML